MVVLVALALAAVDQEVSSGHELMMIMKVLVMELTIIVFVEDYLHQTFSAPPIENYQIVVVAVVEVSAVVAVVVTIQVGSFQSVS